MQSFDKELDTLNQLVLKMADLVEKNIEMAMNYYFMGKKLPTINDDLVDQFERFIEENCLDIMVKERPFARDLRTLTGILTLVEDIERVGDHAEDIYNFSRKLRKSDSTMKIEVKDLFEIVMRMFHNAIRCFVNKDEELAKSVIEKDELVDELYEKKLDELITKWENKQDSSFAIYNTLVVKYLERIADHSVNIAEWVIYIIKGYYKDKQIL
ncbi:MAG: phosphate signaling complex protein PhoU [Bacilli bacterium]